jgi:hypothetical protein
LWPRRIFTEGIEGIEGIEGVEGVEAARHRSGSTLPEL